MFLLEAHSFSVVENQLALNTLIIEANKRLLQHLPMGFYLCVFRGLSVEMIVCDFHPNAADAADVTGFEQEFLLSYYSETAH